MDICETVKIVAVDQDPEAGAFIVINRDDFDPEKHELYEEPGSDAADAKKADKDALIAKGVELKLGTAEDLTKLRIDTLRNKVAAAEKAKV